jgi:hypothetical protein
VLLTVRSSLYAAQRPLHPHFLFEESPPSFYMPPPFTPLQLVGLCGILSVALGVYHRVVIAPGLARWWA